MFSYGYALLLQITTISGVGGSSHIMIHTKIDVILRRREDDPLRSGHLDWRILLIQSTLIS